MEKKCSVVWSLLFITLTVATHGQAYLKSHSPADTLSSQSAADTRNTVPSRVNPGQDNEETFPIKVEEASAANVELASEIIRTAKPENEDYTADENGDPQQVAAGVLNAPEPIALLILGLAGIVLTRMRLRKR